MTEPIKLDTEYHYLALVPLHAPPQAENVYIQEAVAEFLHRIPPLIRPEKEYTISILAEEDHDRPAPVPHTKQWHVHLSIRSSHE